MSEPLTESRLRMMRRRFDDLNDQLKNLDTDETYDPIEIMKECMRAAKCVPELLDEIERLRGEIQVAVDSLTDLKANLLVLQEMIKHA